MSAPLLARDPNTSTPPSPSKQPSDSNLDLEKQQRLSEDQGQEQQEQSKSMEYHRQVLKNKIEGEKAQKLYVSPSDTIMSPCTAKLSAYKSRQFGKAKPQSLFAKMEIAKSDKGGEGI